MLTGSCHCKNVSWRFESPLQSVTACNCTVCRRYGVLWAYGYENEDVHSTGATQAYSRGNKNLGFHFCAHCGSVAFWRLNTTDKDGRRRMAVNVRLIDEPDKIAHLPIDHFDGLDKFEDLPRDQRCVKDMWF